MGGEAPVAAGSSPLRRGSIIIESHESGNRARSGHTAHSILSATSVRSGHIIYIFAAWRQSHMQLLHLQLVRIHAATTQRATCRPLTEQVLLLVTYIYTDKCITSL